MMNMLGGIGLEAGWKRRVWLVEFKIILHEDKTLNSRSIVFN